jgi:hypothetical protein
VQVTPVGWDEAGVQRVRLLDHLGSDVAAICLDCQIGEADGTPLKLEEEGLTSCSGNKIFNCRRLAQRYQPTEILNTVKAAPLNQCCGSGSGSSISFGSRYGSRVL